MDCDRGNCGSNFCIIFFYDRDNTFEYTMKILGCDFGSCFGGVLVQNKRFRLIGTRTVFPVALLP